MGVIAQAGAIVALWVRTRAAVRLERVRSTSRVAVARELPAGSRFVERDGVGIVIEVGSAGEDVTPHGLGR